MAFRIRPFALCAAVAAALVFSSCAKKEKEPAPETDVVVAGDSTLSYVSEEVSFGVFFDAEGSKRTIHVKGGKQATCYIIVSFPETMQIAAVEFRLVLPEGVMIDNDKYYDGRVALIGTFGEGISETFPCVPGPKLVLHELTITVPAGMEDGEIALMPSTSGKVLGVATCDEGYPIVQASAYKAIVNPTN